MTHKIMVLKEAHFAPNMVAWWSHSITNRLTGGGQSVNGCILANYPTLLCLSHHAYAMVIVKDCISYVLW